MAHPLSAPLRDENLPKATHEAKMKIGNITLKVYHLDDGQRVIDEGDYHRLVSAIMDGSLDLSGSPELANELVRFLT